MKDPSRRQGLRWLAATAAAVSWPVTGQPAPRTIEIVAQRFRFTPQEITVAAGESVVLAVRSLDFDHGLSFPDLKLRVDLVADRVVRLALPPQRPGRYGFLCDNFCGDDHEDMHGRLVVQDPT